MFCWVFSGEFFFSCILHDNYHNHFWPLTVPIIDFIHFQGLRKEWKKKSAFSHVQRVNCKFAPFVIWPGYAFGFLVELLPEFFLKTVYDSILHWVSRIVLIFMKIEKFSSCFFLPQQLVMQRSMMWMVNPLTRFVY